MSRTPFCEMVYHRRDYVLADAFRPQPGWGRRTYTVPTAVLDGASDQDLIEGAMVTAPEGYRLTKLALYPADGDKRVIWSAPIIHRDVEGKQS